MSDRLFLLPRDRDGKVVPEEYLQKKYGFAKHTRIHRNLAVRYLYRHGVKPPVILQQAVSEGLHSVQNVYAIIKSERYKYIEEDYHLLD